MSLIFSMISVLSNLSCFFLITHNQEIPESHKYVVLFFLYKSLKMELYGGLSLKKKQKEINNG